jgi:hypothetical protein
MPWVPVTTDDVLALFNDSETTAYNAAKGDTAGADLGATLGLVVSELREAIDGRDLVLGPDGTVPAGFKKKVAGAVRYEFLNALPAGKKLLTPERVAAATAFEELLHGIQSGRIHVVPGDGLTAMALPAVRPRRRTMSLRRQQGL